LTTPNLPQSVTSFSDYFRSNAEVEDILGAFGYTFDRRAVALPQASAVPEWEAELHQRLASGLPLVSLTSEAARREFLIAPVIFDVARFLRAQVRVEYPLDVDARLRGTLDYLVRGRNNLLVIEAKNADLTRGFTQLSVEMVALDQWSGTPPQQTLYGAVSVGDVWQFGVLDRAAKHVTQDLNLYRVPTDLGDLLRILIAILAPAEPDPPAA
jgi:hypothetical protein